MRRAPRFFVALGVALLTTVWAASLGSAHPESHSTKKSQRGDADAVANSAREVYADDDQQHGPSEGHLPPTQRNVTLVGKERVTNLEGRVSDLAYFKGFAYLGAHSAGLSPPECRGGAWVVDVKPPGNPEEVVFIPAAKNTYYTEGMHAIHLDTAAFEGDVLLASVESCGQPRPGTGGGLDIWDITDPTRPQLISRGGGDYTIGDMSGDVSAFPHDAHSTFGWDAGNKAYAALIDNIDLFDVDILDITNPAAPVLVSETGLPEWDGVATDAYGEFPTSHDFVAKQIDGTWHLMVAYWDAGWVDLNVEDPSNPTVIGDTDYLDCDPINPNACPPEGNGHQNEWNRRGGLFLGTDEDQSAFRVSFEIVEGPHAGLHQAGEFSWTVPIADLPGESVNGPTVFGGYGCPDDRDSIPDAASNGVTAGENEEEILVMERGPVGDPNHDHQACFFSEKVETAQLLGYDAAIVANHHAGAQGGEFPEAFICGSKGHEFEVTIPGLCIGHQAMHLLFDFPDDPEQTYPPDYTFPYPVGDPGDVEPDVGDIGYDVTSSIVYDGWGYVHLFNANTLTEKDQLAIGPTDDPAFAQGFGDMSVHEVAVERNEELRRVAYFAWYNAGFRVAVFDGDEIEQTGRFIPEGGHDLWGVELCGFDGQGRRLVCVSDRDFGLFIYRYTGPIAP
jgi:hypothetical protein